MPAWLLWIIGVAGAISALWVIAQKGLRPIAKAITVTDEMVPLLIEVAPLLREFNTLYGDNELLKVLSAIALEFKSNSGSTLRDAINRINVTVEALSVVVDRLETASTESLARAQVAKIGAKAESDLSVDDRMEIAKLVKAVQELVAGRGAITEELHAHTELPVERP